MDFAFTPEEETFRQEVRAFLRDELGDGIERGGSPDRWRQYRGFVKKLAERGWLTLAWPKEWGGQGASYMQQLVYNEEMAAHDAPATDLGSDRVGPTIMLYGTDEQKARFLPPIVSGDAVWCQGFSEPESGSDLASLQTRAVQDGDEFVIGGSKIWTSLAHFAEWIILLARTDPDAPKHKGISYFLVDMNAPGITVRPLVNMVGSHDFNEVFFDNVRVPKENLVGEENRGWYIGTTTLDFERSGIATSVSHGNTVNDYVQYAHDHRNDAACTISHDHALRYELADRAVEAEVERMLSYQVIGLQARGIVPNHESSIAKLYSTELDQRIAATGLKMIGLYGQLRRDSLHTQMNGRMASFYMYATTSTIGGGTSEVQRNIIAQRGLGMPRG